MGIIRNGTMKLKGKKVRVIVFGYENKDKKFIAEESWINETDLVNIGIIGNSSADWNEAFEVLNG